MVDNIYTRIYGRNTDSYLNSRDYSKHLNNKNTMLALAIAIPACYMEKYNNVNVLRYVYKNNGAIILTNVTYCDIKKLHQCLGINVSLSYTQAGKYCCSKYVDTLGYYGICKSNSGNISQLYCELNNINNLQQEVLNGVAVDDVSDWLTSVSFQSSNQIPACNINNMCSKCRQLNKGGLNNNNLSLGVGNASNSSDDLTKIASAQVVTFAVEGSKNIQYYDPSLYKGRTNTYRINFIIYAAHSLRDNSDYYYIEQEGVYNFNNNYVGMYNYDYEGAYSKIEEYYCSNVTTSSFLNVNQDFVDIMRLAPPTTEGQESITSGISWSAGGSFAVNQEGATVTVTGGVSVSNSRTFSVNAVNVFNRSTDNGSNAKWEYLLKKTESEFSFFSYGQVDLIPASNSGHSTFVPFNQWIWRALPDVRQPDKYIQCICDLDLVLTSSRGRLLAPFYTEIDERNVPFSRRFLLGIEQAPIPQ